MRIGIDARFYGTFGKGLGRYTQKLIEHLERIDHENDYFILVRRENWADYQPTNPRFKKVLADFRWYTITEQILLPLKLWTLRLDLVHFTHFNVPLLYWGKFIVTVHDLILTKYPTQRATMLGPLQYALKHFGYRIVIRSAIRRSRRIIAVSKYTKQEVVRYFNVDPLKISVTYEAVDQAQKPSPDSPEALRRYSIQKPYILYVGNVYPHKNVEGLLQAYKKVAMAMPHVRLVIVGKEDYFFKRAKETSQTLGIRDGVIFTGFVTDTDLPEVYRGASLYAFPSFCEGFGLPALEACSYGIPVVASNSSSLPEILGDAALFFNPHSIDEIAHACMQVLKDPQLAETLRARGFARVARFHWSDMARTTLDLYNDVYYS
ncbi:MAG: glycosyltransferase family 1 protein [Patescibacteria group bacterium]|nr:glycosyltransferase family 1 protein [Patescibacteria group bacterium]MDD5715167.1 glycosyltransferase family 1 protein [Patescibacteria group bacterium]